MKYINFNDSGSIILISFNWFGKQQKRRHQYRPDTISETTREPFDGRYNIYKYYTLHNVYSVSKNFLWVSETTCADEGNHSWRRLGPGAKAEGAQTADLTHDSLHAHSRS